MGVWDAFLVHSYSETFRIPRLNPHGWLYSRSVENLFWAHRPVRARRDAPGSARVIYSGRLMGEAAGFAAKLCCESGILPRQWGYTECLNEPVQLMAAAVNHTEKDPGAP